MANPNIVAVSSIYANTVFDADVAASAVSLLTCGSNKLQKINSLIIANIDGTNSATIDVWIHRSSADYYLLKTVAVAADATLVALDKLNALPIYTASQVNTDLSTKDSVNFNIAIITFYKIFV